MRPPPTRELRVRFNLPEAYARAIRIRAAYEAAYPRDVLVRALDLYLAAELAAVRESDRPAGGTPVPSPKLSP